MLLVRCLQDIDRYLPLAAAWARAADIPIGAGARATASFSDPKRTNADLFTVGVRTADAFCVFEFAAFS